jgi:hypothetical protein
LKENSLIKSKTTKITEQVSEILWFYEPNIWDCIFRQLDIFAKNEGQAVEIVVEKGSSPGKNQPIKINQSTPKSPETQPMLIDMTGMEIETKLKKIIN